MLTRLEFENFRGFRRLVVEDLGRFNLIVGRNDSGKTSLAAGALAFGSLAGLSAAALGLTVDSSEGSVTSDFEGRWRHLFRDGDALRGFSIRGSSAPHGDGSVVVQQPRENRPIPDEGWPLEASIVRTNGTTQVMAFRPVAAGEFMASGSWTAWPVVLIGPTAMLGKDFREHLARLKVAGDDAGVAEALQGWSSGVVGIELIGSQVLVRLRGVARLLPIRVLGEGARRVVDIAVSLGAERDAMVAIDEIDAGFHHTVLPEFWRWLLELTGTRGHQVFATTHSDECVLAACRAFQAADDDGLSVIRLERSAEGEHVARVFRGEQVLAALEAGLEVR